MNEEKLIILGVFTLVGFICGFVAGSKVTRGFFESVKDFIPYYGYGRRWDR